MQWLNKLDDVLDNGLRTPRREDEEDKRGESDGNSDKDDAIVEEELFVENSHFVPEPKEKDASFPSTAHSVYSIPPSSLNGAALPGSPRRRPRRPPPPKGDPFDNDANLDTNQVPPPPAETPKGQHIKSNVSVGSKSDSIVSSSSSLPGSVQRRRRRRPSSPSSTSTVDAQQPRQLATKSEDSNDPLLGRKAFDSEVRIVANGQETTERFDLSDKTHNEVTVVSDSDCAVETATNSTSTAVTSENSAQHPNNCGEARQRPRKVAENQVSKSFDKEAERVQNADMSTSSPHQAEQDSRLINQLDDTRPGSVKTQEPMHRRYDESTQQRQQGKERNGVTNRPLSIEPTPSSVTQITMPSENLSPSLERKSNGVVSSQSVNSFESVDLKSKESRNQVVNRMRPQTSAEVPARNVRFNNNEVAGVRSQSLETPLSQTASFEDASLDEFQSLATADSQTLSAPGNDVPLEVQLRSEFAVTEERSNWHVDGNLGPWDNKLNCKGVVFVRLLRAQRLPCSVGSTVHGILALKPWKGRVKTRKSRSFVGPLDENGVCVQWDEDETKPIAMTHAYSSTLSPIPSIELNLMLSSLGVFGFTMCSFTLSCEVLLRFPMIPRRQWFLTSGDSSGGINPMVQLEAVFEPSDPAAHVIPIREVDISENRTSVDDSLLEEIQTSVGTKTANNSSKGDELSQSGLSLSHNSLPVHSSNRPRPKAHLFKLTTHYAPATCCVCGSSIRSGFSRTKAFNCEACSLDCCEDCRLQVDVEFPCGSELAAKAVTASIQTKLSTRSILDVVAPVNDASERSLGSEKFTAVEDDHISLLSRRYDENMTIGREERGIGVMNVNIIQAAVLKTKLPPLADIAEEKERVQNLVKSDYYIRVSRTESNRSARTTTIQSSKQPRFDVQMDFDIPHYGTEFRFELFDAATDTSVGATIVSAQAILQAQRDELVRAEGLGLASIFDGQKAYDSSVSRTLALRTGVKAAFGCDHFPLSDPKKGNASITGWIEVDIAVVEDIDNLYGSDPYECPLPAQSDLDMQVFQLHISRFTALLEDLKDAIDFFQFLVSWRNIFMTLVALTCFVATCIKCDPAYFGCIPFSCVLGFMVCRAFVRCADQNLIHQFVHREIEAHRKAEKVIVDYDLHRPIGLATVSVESGRNLRSLELGLPGNVECHVFWDPVRLLSKKKSKDVISGDKASSISHRIGSTNSEFSQNPAWGSFTASETTKRLKQTLSSRKDCFALGRNLETNEITFPILQPFSRVGKDMNRLQEWSTSPSCLVFEVKFSTPIPGSDFLLGEVCIPLASLIEGKEINDWFEVTPSGDVNARPTSEPEKPQIFVKMRWEEPKHDAVNATPVEREASLVIQEELTRSAIINKVRGQGILSLVSTSVGALNSLRSTSNTLATLQNTLGTTLDLLESLRNLLNFTDPFKSTVVLLSIGFIWLALLLIPTNWVILAAGLVPFAISFQTRFGRSGTVRKVSDSTAQPVVADQKPSRPIALIMNALRGLPTNEDLRRAYYWESRRICEREIDEYIEKKRSTRLERLWRAQWYSKLEILEAREKTREMCWGAVFAVVQGHRFLWWQSALDFDDGEDAAGQIFLEGHAGVATPSPIEAKAIGNTDIQNVVCIFGRGASKQQARVTLLAPSAEQKIGLERAVEFAIVGKKD